MVGIRVSQACFLVLLMISAPLSGCFGEDDSGGLVAASDVTITPKVLVGGSFQPVTVAAGEDMSVFLPYLVIDEETGYVANSTVLDLRKGDSVQLSLLAPPRAGLAVALLGEYGRDSWPIRDANESWASWFSDGGHLSADGGAVKRSGNGTGLFNASSTTGGAANIVTLVVERPNAPAYSSDEGGRHSTGLVSGRTTYNYLHHITDETPDPLDLTDGAVGYLNRWAGQGNTAYEAGAVYLIDKLESFGLMVDTQRFEFTDVFGNQNPESYNICGFRYGSEVPNEWMVFGAHFDVAPPANALCWLTLTLPEPEPTALVLEPTIIQRAQAWY